MFRSLLLAGIDSGFNALLRMDPVSLQRMTGLSGRVLAIRAREPEFSLHLLFHDEGIQLASAWDAPADCTLSAPVAELWKLAMARDKAAALYQPGMQIEGDNNLLVQLSEILQDMNIDWEFQLGQWLGPVAAGLIGSHVQQRSQWAAASVESLHRRVQEWLAEESRLLVGRNEAESRFQELDRLKLQLDRLEARTALLARQLEPDTQ